MADFLTIDFQGLTQVQASLSSAPAELTNRLDYALEKSAREIELRANQKKPVDLGGMQVRVDSQPLRKEITVNAFYAPFIEFGTGKYAAQYVSTLPTDWQTYAANYKGQSGAGNFKDFVQQMIAWVRRKGIGGTFSIRTQRRTGNRAAQQAQDEQLGYVIAKSILINGVHPHPFLYPAFNEVKPLLEADIANLINTFSI